MDQIKKQLETSRRAICRALKDVNQGGRLELSTHERRCTRLWGALSAAWGQIGDLELGADQQAWELFGVLGNACIKFERVQKFSGCNYEFWVFYLENGSNLALDIIDRVLDSSRAPATLSTEDEWAIRRAVWSAFVSSGGQKAQCPYPVGHAHREIWVDELAIVAKEHHQKILEQTPPPAPSPEPLDMGEALRVFCSLPMGNESGGEIIDMPALDETKSLSALSNAH